METDCEYVIPKRSYIYQTSKEVKRVEDSAVEREKIDAPSNERSTGNEKWLYSGKTDEDASSCLLDLLFPNDSHILCSRIHSTNSSEGGSGMNLFNMFPEDDGNLRVEREKVDLKWRICSAKNGLCHFDVDVNTPGPSTGTRPDLHSHLQDAYMELKSHHNSSPARKKITDSINTRVSDTRQHNSIQHPLLPTFTRIRQDVEGNTNIHIEKAKEDVAPSPVHLNGILKQENRGDGIFFEFFTKDREDVLCAKTSRPENAVHWVYTFHRSKKKNNSGVWSIKDRRKKSSILVGQMCASCELFAKSTSDGHLKNFMQLDFVLYDIDQPRVKSSDEKSLQHTKVSSNHQGPRKAVNSVYPENCMHTSPNLPYNSDIYVTHLREQNNLLPSLEIAAIVMQVPVEADYIEWEKEDLFLSNNSLQTAPVYGDKTVKSKSARSININVIAPAGHHGMPHAEGGPLPLIERWKSGGQCDCGGWDIGCPILVLENHDKKADNYSGSCFNHSVKLHVQGSKDRMPALTVTTQAEKGEYLVEFHAQFSAVQAFAISVAVLHCLERNISMLHSNVLKSLLKDELNYLLDVTAEDVIKAQEEMRFKKPVPGKYILDPPFSPIRRA